MPIVIENANLRFPKCQFDIMENYKPFIAKWFMSLIGDQTSLQLIKILRDTGAFQSWKVKCKGHIVFFSYLHIFR
jgi:hypothetical protein